MFQRRILGLTSYYIGATPDKFASKVVHYKNLVMSPYHEEVYNHFEEIEEQKEKMKLECPEVKLVKICQLLPVTLDKLVILYFLQ